MSEYENISSSSSKSLLPEKVIEYLNKGMKEGFEDGRLDLRSRNIKDSMMLELCEWIAKLGDKVKILDLKWNEITSVGSSMLYDTLKTNSLFIKDIHLSSNRQIDDKCMKSLGEYIKSNIYIKAISLDHTKISDAGIEILSPYLYGNTAFKVLHLKGNKGITDKSIPLLMKMVESSCIEYMRIEKSSVTQKNTIYALVGCNAIKNGSASLYLSRNGLNDENLIKICDAMKKYGIDKLNEINLERNEIISKGASVLFDTLIQCNSVVSHLNLSYNQLDDECMKQLGEYLQDNEQVEVLGLVANKITDKGVEILSEHLIGNITLKELQFAGNKGISDKSIPHLIEIAHGSSVTTIGLYSTSISDKKQQEIKEALSIPIEEREIPIKSNTKSATKVSAST